MSVGQGGLELVATMAIGLTVALIAVSLVTQSPMTDQPMGSTGLVTTAAFQGSGCLNGVCDGNENAASCPVDCPSVCGDGLCTHYEKPANCAVDCNRLLGPVNRMFVSSVEYSGSLDGTKGADAKCKSLAQAANLGGN